MDKKNGTMPSILVSITNLIEDHSGVSVLPDADIWLVTGMSGDDWHEFIASFSSKFGVNMDAYLWYYHGDEEGTINIGALLFPPPHDQVRRIPVRPTDLARIAKQGEWSFDYPETVIDVRRRDLTINRVLALIILMLGVVLAAKKYGVM
ncbi:DUF1493 family protein [Neolewinella maritima]|uniref:DUF1493 family protein n=1 Tax=Neolewinella maritima TaxID=1383882 RepID=UPI001EE85D1D|nr:DUF1493 family protein [Neolewinella maritima]